MVEPEGSPASANCNTPAVVSALGGRDGTETVFRAIDALSASNCRYVSAARFRDASFSQRRFAACLLSVFMFTTAEAARPSEIWVVTDSKHPIKVRAGVRLIELDAPARLDAELAANLPRDPASASAVVQQRLNEARLRARLTEAYQGVVDAWSLGIAKIPAVVVDRQFVVYGELDVDIAISKIDQYRRNP